MQHRLLLFRPKSSLSTVSSAHFTDGPARGSLRRSTTTFGLPLAEAVTASLSVRVAVEEPLDAPPSDDRLPLLIAIGCFLLAGDPGDEGQADEACGC